MGTAPDFETLRAERNSKVQESMQRLADEYGFDLSKSKHTFDPNSCYCACISGGPCEHKWDGDPYESEDGLCWSTTCSRCGCTCMSHDMKVLP
jgi:hypothetical protein